jgi:hypothetical protein
VSIKTIVDLAKARQMRRVSHRQFIAQLAAEVVSIDTERDGDTLSAIIIFGAEEEGEG